MAKSIYISGKITGLPETEAFHNFLFAEAMLASNGWACVNPMKIGFGAMEKSWANFMIADLKALIPCNAIYMLSNWHESQGARIEHAFAIAMAKEVYYQSRIINFLEEVSNG